MTTAQTAATLTDDPRLIIPVGTVERFATGLPLGAATIIVERLADDLSAEFGVLRAPTIEYGVNPATERQYAGAVCVRKKTLHRMLNDMIGSWEINGVAEFILLTAHAYDPHQEALDTVGTVSARVRVVDIFAVNLSDLMERRRSSDDRSDLYLTILRYLTPELIEGDESADDTERGRRLYEHIRARVSERIFLAPAPAE